MNRCYSRFLFLTAVISALMTGNAIAEWASPNTIGMPPASRGKEFNPAIGSNFLVLLRRGTGTSDLPADGSHDGIQLQEAEFQFAADVDPYFRAVSLLAIAPDAGAYEIEPEEVYLETLSLPSVTLKIGKFKTDFGKQNRLHQHALPFIDLNLINQDLLGDEGLNESGISAAVLLPTSWYSEVTAQAISLTNASLYGSPSSRQIGGVGRLKNLFDLTEDLTMEVGLSGTTGQNSQSLTASAYGADLTMKWRPAKGGKYKALIWSTEYMQGKRNGLTDPTTGDSWENLGGMATWLQYQFAERWWIQGRYEYVGINRSSATQPQKYKQSVLVGFFPTEFSGIRLQYDHSITEGRDSADHTVGLQFNMSIGAHPAHAY